MRLLLGVLPLILSLLFWATSSPEAGRLEGAGMMASPRAAHTATVLPDGEVLLAGGLTGGAALAPTERYDPATGTFVPAASMLQPRQSHTATVLPNGQVLLAGGYDAQGNYLASMERYDPVTGAFTQAARMREARANHLAVPLPGGQVLFIGGVGVGWTFLASAELYDPATDTLTPTGPMAAPRESHVAVLLGDGRVLVVGGHRGRRASIHLYTSAEVYDPATARFAPAGEMNIRRHKHDAVRLPDGSVLITGGTDERDSHGRYTSAERYDPATGVFSTLASMNLPRYKHQGTSIVLPDGRVLLAGGAPEAEVYDPKAGRFWRVDGTARMVGQFSAAALLPDGRVLITGGYGEGRGPQASAWIYHPE